METKKQSLTFKEFKNNWETVIIKEKPDYIRKGQSLMNYLTVIWLEEYERISSVHYYDEDNLDCFYNDQLLPNTLKHLEKVWKLKND